MDVKELTYAEIQKEYEAAFECAFNALENASKKAVKKNNDWSYLKITSEDLTKLVLTAFMERRRSIARKGGY